MSVVGERAREWSKRVKRAEQSVALQSAAERVSEVPSMISTGVLFPPFQVAYIFP